MIIIFVSLSKINNYERMPEPPMYHMGSGIVNYKSIFLYQYFYINIFILID